MRWLWISALVALGIDQLSKYVIVHSWELWRIGTIEVRVPFLSLRYGENRGINFGLLGGDVSQWILIGLAAAICAGVLWWLTRAQRTAFVYACAGLLVGGALGNVIDRMWYGYVLDFLNVSCCGLNNPYVFNIADVFVFAGAIGLAFFGENTKRG